MRPDRGQRLAEHAVRSPTAAAARTRRDASPGDSRSVAIKVRTMVRLGQHLGQVPPLRVGDRAGGRPTACRFRICSKSWVNVTKPGLS